MKVFVSGGAGFIGSHLVDQFIKDGHDVVAYDNLILGKTEFLDHLQDQGKFKFVEADLLDLPKLQGEMKGADLVVHMAANSDISQGAEKTGVDMQNGTVATYNILEAMRINRIGKLLFASTSAIYGEAEQMPTSESYGPLFPISYYGASKLACEAMISAFSHCCGIQAWVYRFANIVGSRATHGAIYDFVLRLRRDPKRLMVLGNGSQRKSYLHVSECVSGMLFGYTHARATLNCFNLASQGVSNVRFIAEEVALQMAATNGIRAEVIFGTSDRGWVGDVPYTYLDGSLLAELGWQAVHDSDSAVRKAIAEVIKQTGEN